MNILPYDHTDPKSIENYAKNLIGLSFFDALKNNFLYYISSIPIDFR
ncbi:hypothetical protein ACF3NF_04775 [Anaerococcus martiniensis]